MPDLSLGRLRAILDFGEKLGFNPDALVADAFGIGLGLADEGFKPLLQIGRRYLVPLVQAATGTLQRQIRFFRSPVSASGNDMVDVKDSPLADLLQPAILTSTPIARSRWVKASTCSRRYPCVCENCWSLIGLLATQRVTR